MAAKVRANRTKLSKKTVQSTESLRERMLLLSNKKRPKVNRRDTQVLCFESSMKFRIAKTS
jgi:hypothetical protein